MIPVVRRHLWWVSGLVLVVAGAALALLTPAAPAEVSFISSAPLGEGPDWEMAWGGSTGAPAFLMTWWQLTGCVVVALGLLVLAAGTGFRLGRRVEPTADEGIGSAR